MGKTLTLNRLIGVRYPFFCRSGICLARHSDDSISASSKFSDGTLVFMNWRPDTETRDDNWEINAGRNVIRVLAYSYGGGEKGIAEMTSDLMDIAIAHHGRHITEYNPVTGAMKLRLSSGAPLCMIERLSGEKDCLPYGYFPGEAFRFPYYNDADIRCYGVKSDDDIMTGMVNALSVLFERCGVEYSYNPDLVNSDWETYQTESMPTDVYVDYQRDLAKLSAEVGTVTGYSPRQIALHVFQDLQYAFEYTDKSKLTGGGWEEVGFYEVSPHICFTRNWKPEPGDPRAEDYGV